VAAQSETEVIAAGAANPSGETEADGPAPAAKADGARPTAKAVAHASIAAATKAVAHASIAAAAKTNAVTAAAAKAKTNAVTAASTAHGGLGLRRNRERQGKRAHGRQEEPVHHPVIHAFRLPIWSTANAAKLWEFQSNRLGRSCGKLSLASKKLGRGLGFC
jgi:hypothetical protein